MLLVSLMSGLAVASETEQPAETSNPLFPFCIETHDAKKRSIEQQVALAKELGFSGLGHLWLENVPERLKALDEAGLKLYWIHTTVNVNPDKRPFDPKLMEVLPLLKDRGVLLSINAVGAKPSDESVDPRAVEIFRQIADEAAKHGVRVVLYHHRNDWTERFSDCVRVVKKIDRPNVGVMFNLCHWLLKGKEEELEALLKSGKPYLHCVAINGADRPAEVQSGKGNFIQPLGDGTFDVGKMLKMLNAQDYKGPIGLMCWGIKGDARDHLTRSMAAWKKMQ